MLRIEPALTLQDKSYKLNVQKLSDSEQVTFWFLLVYKCEHQV